MQVRGFWGDILNSPFISFGNEIADEEHRMRFHKTINYQVVYSNTDISCYNIQRIIHKFEQGKEYQFPFERLKHVMGKQYVPMPSESAGKEEPEVKRKAEKEEDMFEELTEEQAAEEERKAQEKKEKQEAEKKAKEEAEAKIPESMKTDETITDLSKKEPLKISGVSTIHLESPFLTVSI